MRGSTITLGLVVNTARWTRSAGPPAAACTHRFPGGIRALPFRGTPKRAPVVLRPWRPLSRSALSRLDAARWLL